MKSTLEVLFTPADFSALASRDLSATHCVVYDVLRATTSMLTALANGANSILPVRDIPEAMKLHSKMPGALLAGERDGVRILAAQTGSVDFDHGNSPREFTIGVVANRDIIMTTTNGTRALQACAGAKQILAAAWLNLQATAVRLERDRAKHLIVVCAGTYEEAAYEDTLAAGALCDLVWDKFDANEISDSAQIARQIYLDTKNDAHAGLARHSKNARRLLSMPALRDDVAFCFQRDHLGCVAAMRNGAVRIIE